MTAALVLRLRFRQVPIDPGHVWVQWLRRPAIEITLGRRGVASDAASQRLAARIDEMYPF